MKERTMRLFLLVCVCLFSEISWPGWCVFPKVWWKIVPPVVEPLMKVNCVVAYVHYWKIFPSPFIPKRPLLISQKCIRTQCNEFLESVFNLILLKEDVEPKSKVSWLRCYLSTHPADTCNFSIWSCVSVYLLHLSTISFSAISHFWSLPTPERNICFTYLHCIQEVVIPLGCYNVVLGRWLQLQWLKNSCESKSKTMS